eukprot:TRINITY_DN35186_c0_g1_i2.p1 TRINITY_DN35186_c0_g1~~TRINITY_DN35186_c0_g1_i2.p1  ORF type:complete len:910 (+),score=163.99 TRINITY_DN35186_c0_g1_i2:121-2850(+)
MLHLRWRLLPRLLVCLVAANDECWIGDFTASTCCVGNAGNPDCWDGKTYTFENCCPDVGSIKASATGSQTEDIGLVENRSSAKVVSNDQLQGFNVQLREAFQEHLVLEEQGLALCRPDGSVMDAALAAAREEASRALEESSFEDATGVHKQPLPSLAIDAIYKDYASYLASCPQAVLQGSATYLERLLRNLRQGCSDLSLVRACQANTPFMLDSFLYHVVLKHGLIELYSETDAASPKNVSVADVFRGWPILEQEERMWTEFTALWKVIWPQRDFCSCVEGYDYYATMHAMFDQVFKVSRRDFPRRTLRATSAPRRAFASAEHCEDWLDKDFKRLFSSYAKLSACVPGAIMENVVCMHRWLLDGEVVGALNTAELMVKLVALCGACLDDTRWPFDRDDILQTFARLALRWHEADVGCTALNRFGQTLNTGPCPTELTPATVERLLWRGSPLQTIASRQHASAGRHSWPRSPASGSSDAHRQTGSICTADLQGACIVAGKIIIPDGALQGQEDAAAVRMTESVGISEVGPDAWALRASPALQTCSETGRNLHAVAVRSPQEIETIRREDAEQDKRAPSIGFILNAPIFSDNVWHNAHWLVPAVARLHDQPRRWKGRVPDDVQLILVFSGYSFTETPPELFSQAEDDDDDSSTAALDSKAAAASTELEPAFVLEKWVQMVRPWVDMLTSSPPTLLNLVKKKCYSWLLWGHAEMRADREFRQADATGPADVDLFRQALTRFHGVEMDKYASSFWKLPAAAPRALALQRPIRVVLAQRDAGHGRSFENVDSLVAAGLEPLASTGHAQYRMVGHLGGLPLVHQAAIFRGADIFIGAVGAALAWLLVMRPGSQVLEWLPRGVPPPLYRCSEAWNADSLGMFGGLGRLSGATRAYNRTALSLNRRTSWFASLRLKS